jgi:hypothetical protein
MKTPGFPRAVAQANGFDRKTLAAYRAAVRRFGTRGYVTGITISIKVKERTGELQREVGPVIAIHVRKKRRRGLPRWEKIPQRIQGVLTDVIEADYTPSINLAVAIPTPVTLPLRPGASIGRRPDGSAATLGGIVRDANGVRYLLTAAHALTEGKNPKLEDMIVHPGPLDTMPIPPAPLAVASVARLHRGADQGIARLSPQNLPAQNVALGSNVRIKPPANGAAWFPRQGDELRKSGRTTKDTSAIVLGFGEIFGLRNAVQLRALIGNGLPAFNNGDSGAVWFHSIDETALAVHIGTDKTGIYGVATSFAYLLDRWELTWE